MRTHWCGELRAANLGTQVAITGWVHRRRDHGGVIFLDLRDREGLVQVVVHPDEQPEDYKTADGVRAEYVLLVKGLVRPRLKGAVNPNLPTGEIEIAPSTIEVLAESATPPFTVEDGIEANEEIRLRYRYLDLRRPEVQKVFMLRHRTVAAIRRYFDDEAFIEIETPMLNKSTPEGARDYLVPSRLQPGSFFALQQSPQLFKQLLMVAGLDRYYQIVRCFRDEDPRADRQPDFTQLDAEISFADESMVQEIAEGMFRAAAKAAMGLDLPTPFMHMTYEEAMESYGTDKPDLRFDVRLADITSALAGTGVQVFAKTLASGGSAYAISVPGGAAMDRKQLDGLTQLARRLGAGGLAWITFTEDGISSPLAAHLSPGETEDIQKAVGAETGDTVLIVCDTKKVARRVLGEVRLACADLLGLRPVLPPDDPNAWKFVWVDDAPLVDFNEKESRWDPVHHPFTAPKDEDLHLMDSDPGAVRARSYDAVLNGWEVAGGSVRIHEPGLQRKVFSLIGIDDETAERRFGWFVKAFDYGAPPHAGFAMGLDRFVALLAGKDNIREVIAFPKTSAMTDIMTGAPDRVDEAQLAELHLTTTSEES
ncbi:MAG: aspartate--tRNA ligase [Actinomycetota bacterium]